MDKKLEVVREEQKKLQTEMLKQMLTLSTSGFGLVAALAWNNVIQEFFKVYVYKWLPKGSSVFTLLMYAVIVTSIAVLVTYNLSKLLKTEDTTKKGT
jgi:hypothetical protein